MWQWCLNLSFNAVKKQSKHLVVTVVAHNQHRSLTLTHAHIDDTHAHTNTQKISTKRSIKRIHRKHQKNDPYKDSYKYPKKDPYKRQVIFPQRHARQSEDNMKRKTRQDKTKRTRRRRRQGKTKQNEHHEHGPSTNISTGNKHAANNTALDFFNSNYL